MTYRGREGRYYSITGDTEQDFEAQVSERLVWSDDHTKAPERRDCPVTGFPE